MTAAEVADRIAEALTYQMQRAEQEKRAIDVRIATLNDAVNIAEDEARRYRQHQPEEAEFGSEVSDV